MALPCFRRHLLPGASQCPAQRSLHFQAEQRRRPQPWHGKINAAETTHIVLKRSRIRHKHHTLYGFQLLCCVVLFILYSSLILQ
jgi:hypothetical protein